MNCLGGGIYQQGKCCKMIKIHLKVPNLCPLYFPVGWIGDFAGLILALGPNV